MPKCTLAAQRRRKIQPLAQFQNAALRAQQQALTGGGAYNFMGALANLANAGILNEPASYLGTTPYRRPEAPKFYVDQNPQKPTVWMRLKSWASEP